MTDDSIDHIRNPAHVDASLSMNDRDTIISNMLKAATVENERLRAAERNYQAAHDLQDEKIERLRAATSGLCQLVAHSAFKGCPEHVKACEALGDEQKADKP